MLNTGYCGTVALTLFLGLVCSSYGCFIRNCPLGGKRSMDILPRGTKPCSSCGPGNDGQCVGPSICCGSFGCYFGTPESHVCAKENDNNEPCAVSGAPCGSHGRGNCVADGICCDSVACSLNAKCQTEDGTNSEQLLSLLNRLLQARRLEE